MSGGAWKAFRDAATRPSLPAIVGTLVVAALVLASAALVLTPARLALVDPGWLQIRYDKQTLVTLRSYRIRESPREPLGVAMIGASDFDHALPGEEDMSAELSRQVGQRVSVHILCAGGMRVWDMRALVDSLGDRVGGAILIGSSPMLFVSAPRQLGRSLREPRFGFASDAVHEEILLAGFEAPRITGLYFLDHYRFLAPRLNAALAHVFLEPVRQPGWELAPLAPGERIPFGPRLRRTLAGRKLSSEILDRLIERRRARGPVEIALVEMPWHPRSAELISRRQRRAYEDLVADIQRRHDVHYWDLRESARIRAGDYGDAFHIARPAARWRFARELAIRLAPLLRARAAQTG